MATLLFKVYLSSTLKDLVEERKAVEDALRDQCVVTHSYRASEDSVALSCLQDVADCDLYIGIVGLRYGFIPTSGIVNENGLSITELEYRHAKENDIPRLMFLKDENVIPYTQTDAKSKEHPSERIEEVQVGCEHRPARSGFRVDFRAPRRGAKELQRIREKSGSRARRDRRAACSSVWTRRHS